MQPLERQTHHGGPDRGADDKEGEQVSVQQPEAFHSEISGRQESDHVDFGAGCQTESDDARNRAEALVLLVRLRDDEPYFGWQLHFMAGPHTKPQHRSSTPKCG